MNKFLSLTAVAAMFALQSVSASATPVDLTLDFTGITTATLGTVGITGGQVFSGTVANVASAPIGGSGNFFSVGSPDHANTESATLTLTPGTYNYISFLWGTVDSENTLTLNFSDGTSFSLTGDDVLSPADRVTTYNFGFGVEDAFIDSVVFSNGTKGNVAFEIDNITASAVPEPEAYAMMLSGLGLIGFAARRRKNQA